MKELFIQFSGYNMWANQLLLDTILQLPEEKQYEKVISSFDSLYKTVLHIWDAESIWWQRMKLQERIVRPGESVSGKMKEVSEGLLHQNRQWNDWIISVQEHVLQHVFQYQNSKREQFKQPLYEMLLHLFNHATYHRGQIVTMLRELGIEKIPPTDFIVWSRKK
jgi:uncharacterized damage-inducible protein DinB